MDLQLADKIAVISGGSTGIGRAVAEGLAQEGVHLALCARDAAEVAATAAQIAAQYGVRAAGYPCDVTDSAALEAFMAAVEHDFGGVDILINNAGAGSEETILNAPDDRWYHYWDLHVMAALRLARGLAPLMQARGGGVILNNASICAAQPLYHEPIYNVTKAALVMFSKCLAHELIPYNIRVNAVNPGLVLTAGWSDYAKEQVQGTEQSWEDYLGGVARQHAPIGRFATPEELAHTFVFLCSPRASYTVGASVYVDGGWLRTTT